MKMYAKKTILSIIFIALLHGTMLPISANNMAKESSQQLKDLKKIMECWKKKEGCSSREILVMSTILVGLIAIVSGTTYGILTFRKKSRSLEPKFRGKTPFLEVAPERGWTQFALEIDKDPAYTLPSIPPITELEAMNIPGATTAEDKAYDLLKPSMLKIAEQYGSLGAIHVYMTQRAHRIVAILKAAGFDDKTINNIQIRLNNVILSGE